MVSSSETLSVSFVSKRSGGSPEIPTKKKKLTIKVKNQQGEEVVYKTGYHAPLKKLMAAYSIKKDLDYHSVRFLFNGKLLKSRQTPAQLKMEEGDEICSVMELGGGGPYAP